MQNFYLEMLIRIVPGFGIVDRSHCGLNQRVFHVADERLPFRW